MLYEVITLRVGRVVASGLRLEGPLSLPDVDVEAEFGAGGRVASVRLSGEQVNGLLTPREKDIGFDVSVRALT